MSTRVLSPNCRMFSSIQSIKLICNHFETSVYQIVYLVALVFLIIGVFRTPLSLSKLTACFCSYPSHCEQQY